MDELKAKLLEMFKWFHNFCVEHDLRYYMVGGTLLGAVRHEGFIPWDDDIDLGMPREDYEKLGALIGNKEIGRYYLETPSSPAKNYLFAFSKLYDTQTTLTEYNAMKLRRGIFLDIFPLDGAGKEEEEAREYLQKYVRKKARLNARILLDDGRGSFVKRLARRIYRALPLNEKKLQKKLEEYCRKKPFAESEYVANFNGAWDLKELASRAQFGTPKLYPFEGESFYGVEDYDGYLTGVYGDWRKLPPEEKRVSHHGYFELDLQRPYKEE